MIPQIGDDGFRVIVHWLPPADWFATVPVCKELCSGLREFLHDNLRSFEACEDSGIDLRLLAKACPSLVEVNFSKLGISDEHLGVLARSFPRLQSLNLNECRGYSDIGILSVFTHCKNLNFLDVSYNRSLTDVPFAAAPQSLKKLRAWGCSRLTHFALDHISERCSDLIELHFTTNWRLEIPKNSLVSSLSKLHNLQILECLDVDIDDEFAFALATLSNLSELSVMCQHTACSISDFGLECLARGLSQSLTRILFDPCGPITSRGLAALGTHCLQLEELEMITATPDMGRISGLQFSPSLTRLCLEGCGLRGELDCRNLPHLRVLWVFQNPGLVSILGSGQSLRKLNIGETGCSAITGFGLKALELIDLSDLGFSDGKVWTLLKPGLRSLEKVVLGGNVLSSKLLLEVAEKASRLTHLNLARCSEASVAKLLQALAESSSSPSPLMPRLEVLETSPSAVAEVLCVLQPPVLDC
eukprot:TRINITY_DN21224_c0_g1_i2.p1 TRINITY_DN21224_c0_g1~~TRINITY_DN21224_c0_g1_i2.p1  ORF type:complete len:473 (+),score=67.72 TRINITY_DN21224_c0_g1_i2:80-1498(+)